MIVTVVGTVAAAPNVYGTGGLIEIPDDTTYPVGFIAPAYHFVSGVSDDDNANFFTAGVGILPNLSISGGIKFNGGTDALINAKYRLLSETVKYPSVTIGVVDAAAQIDPDGNPGFYIVLGKSLTPYLKELAERGVVRGYFGFGGGVLDGIFAGLDWRITRQLSAIGEYVGSDRGLDNDAHINLGLRYDLSPELKLDLGVIDFDNFTVGVSYNFIRF
jgi:hypothetical protein